MHAVKSALDLQRQGGELNEVWKVHGVVWGGGKFTE
jgi:hypothetical protein